MKSVKKNYESDDCNDSTLISVHNRLFMTVITQSHTIFPTVKKRNRRYCISFNNNICCPASHWCHYLFPRCCGGGTCFQKGNRPGGWKYSPHPVHNCQNESECLKSCYVFGDRGGEKNGFSFSKLQSQQTRQNIFEHFPRREQTVWPKVSFLEVGSTSEITVSPSFHAMRTSLRFELVVVIWLWASNTRCVLVIGWYQQWIELTFSSTVMQMFLLRSWQSVKQRLWEIASGKYDNWCLFIVLEVCSTAQKKNPRRDSAEDSAGCTWFQNVTDKTYQSCSLWFPTQEFNSARAARGRFIQVLCSFHFTAQEEKRTYLN